MLKKVLLVLVLTSGYVFAMSASVVQSASKEKLGCIKGLGIKRVEAIISYRKAGRIYSLEDLLSIKGIGKVTVKNIRNDTYKKVCTSFTKSKKKKLQRKKKDIKAE